MMTKLRQFSKLFIIIVAVSFIGLMVFEWGMGGFGPTGNTVVGSVNGKKLTYDQFSELYQMAFENARARSGQELDENALRQLRQSVWEQFIQRTLFTEEMEKLGIAVTDSEIVYQIVNYPLEDFKTHPSFQTNEQFDMNKYRAALSDPNIPWLRIEEMYRESLPFTKLQNIITNTIRVSEEEVLDEFKRNNLKANVEYLSILPNTFIDSDSEISDSDIRSFYNKHREDYRQQESRNLSYVLFPLIPTAQDTQVVMSDFERIRERLANGEDFNDLAIEYSEDPSVKNNRGDLGYFDRGSMVPAFSDAAFSAEEGEIVGPVKSSFGYHLIKVEDKKTEDGEEKVKASHILLKIVAGPSTVEEENSKARYFAEDAKLDGFEEAAQHEGLEIRKTGMIQENIGFVPGFGRNSGVLNFAFSSQPGDVSNVFSTDAGYAVVMLSDIQEEGYRPLEDVRAAIESRIRLDRAKQKAREYALTLSDDMEAGTPFEKIAEADTGDHVTYKKSGLFTIDQSLTGVGRFASFSANAFAMETGERSGLIETDRGFYYQHLLDKTDFDSSAFENQKGSIRTRLLNEKKNRVFVEWYESLKEDADIVDNRRQFGLL